MTTTCLSPTPNSGCSCGACHTSQAALWVEETGCEMLRTDRGSSQTGLLQRTRKRISKTAFSCATLLFLLNWSGAGSNTTFRNSVDTCARFAQPLGMSDLPTFPTQILSMLIEVDHIFVLSTDACKTKLPEGFSGRATCVIGSRVDACAPKEFVQGPHAHAMKVSFTHAVVLYLAENATYRHIAVIEDDAAVRQGAFSATIVTDFYRILRSKTWSMIRLGFRPYFLEESSREHCPSRCRCYVKRHVAEQFCELRARGCDMRSSDFYIIRREFFASLRLKLLDLKQANSKRIVDTRPMRSFAHQWLILPQLSIQTKLDVPVDYQLGLGALYVKKCVHPRPVSTIASQQLFNALLKRE